MDIARILKWVFFTFCLTLNPRMEGHPVGGVGPNVRFAPRPLCNFQLALANQACAYLPFTPVPPPPPPSPPLPVPPPPGSPPDDDESYDHSHGHVHGHPHGRIHGHGHVPHGPHGPHGHAHRHAHVPHVPHVHGHRHHRHRSTPVEIQCCKWLAQVEDECVCELLVHLPPFLAKPIHEYTVTVTGSCNVTYSCGGRLRM